MMKDQQQTFPWPELLYAGLGVLKWSPEQFWRATPKELAAAFGPQFKSFGRADLEQMMKEFPDD